MSVLLFLGRALAGGFGWLRILLRWAGAHPWPALCLVLAAWTGWLQLHTLPLRDATIAVLARRAVAEQRAHDQTKRTFAHAQVLAAGLLRQQRDFYEAKSKEDARHADERLAQLRTRLAAAVDRYAAANRASGRVPVGPAAAAGGSATSQTAAPAPGGSAGGSDGPGAAADLVAITLSDLRICTDNTARLLVVHDWAIDLQQRGVQP